MSAVFLEDIKMVKRPRSPGGFRSRNTATLMLRLPPELKEKLQQASERSLRRITAETVHRLEMSFEGEVFDSHGSMVGLPNCGVK